MPELSSYLPLLVAAVLSYFFGRWQTKHQRLYERQAEVIAGLFERYEDVDQRIHSLLAPYEPGGEPRKSEKVKLTVESFNELFSYHRRNSLWLSRGINEQMSAFIERHRKTVTDFQDALDDQDYPYNRKDWMEIQQTFDREAPEMREILEEEFRASLGDTWAKLSRLRRRWFGS